MARVSTDELKWWLALSSIKGVGWATFFHLLEHYHTPRLALQALRTEGRQNHHRWGVAAELAEEAWQRVDEFQEAFARADALGINIVTFLDPEYPGNLRDVDYKPPFIYVRGAVLAEDSRAFAVVGTLEPSVEGIARAKSLTASLVTSEYTIVSGLARGIDTVAHETALASHGRTIAVLGTGLDVVYPPENAVLADRIPQHGAIISQFPLGSRPQRHTFPLRNRVMSALGLGTIIVEAHAKCGSIVQADFAFQQGRKVYLLQSNLDRADNEWAWALVERGGHVVRRMEDILQTVDVQEPSATSAQLNMFTLERSDDPQDPPHQVRDIAVLFDLEGTLFDAEPLMLAAYSHAINSESGKDASVDDMRSAVHLSPYAVLGRWLPKHKVRPGYQAYSRFYSEHFGEYARLYDGVEETLRHIVSQGYHTGIVTSQARRRVNLILGLSPVLQEMSSVLVTWEDARGRKKPNPYPIALALQRLPSKPRVAYYVGDTAYDILAGRRAGTNTVAVTWGLTDTDTLAKYDPDFIIDSIDELPHVLHYDSPSVLPA